MNIAEVRKLLDYKADEYEQKAFILNDPIAIPHLFTLKQDIEIAGFFTATIAWGNRTGIINSSKKLLSLMDNAPYDFILNHNDDDLKPFLHFVHRTFQATDVLYFIHWLQWWYQENESLEQAFFTSPLPLQMRGEQSAKNVPIYNIKESLIHFHHLFFSLENAPGRTRKHVSTPAKKSACKRLNMLLRWMIRNDSPVDFGIWNSIHQKELMIPLDIHVGNIARRLGLLHRKQNDWQAVEELTTILRTFNSNDPAKYDYALFALGAEERYS